MIKVSSFFQKTRKQESNHNVNQCEEEEEEDDTEEREDRYLLRVRAKR